MRLRDLEAQFIQREVRREIGRFVKPEPFAAKPSGPYTDDDIEEREHDAIYHPFVDTLGEAHGIMFQCPLCYAQNNGPMGTHSVICWFVGKVPDDADPKPGRWTPQGTSIDDLTFIPSEGLTQSVLLLGGCGWHGLVVNGDAT